MTTDNPTLAAALSYARRGWSVIPLSYKAKTPLIPWKHYQTRRPTDSELRGWLEGDHARNLALVTGQMSGVIVLDVDDTAGLQSVRGCELPLTPCVKTGRGLHYYFKHPGGDVGNKAAMRPGLDLRGDGGYVVLPPSRHPNGQRYEWQISPDEADLADAPAWLVDLIRSTPTTEERPPAPARPPIGGGTAYGLAGMRKETDELSRATEGKRNASTNRAAFALGQLVAGGELPRDLAERELEAAALATGLPQDEARTAIKSGLDAGMKEPRSAPQTWVQHAPGGNGHNPDAQIGATVARGQGATSAELPEIIATGRPMRDVTADALTALDTAETQSLFVRSGELTRISETENGLPIIERMSEAAVRGRMERSAQFMRLSKGKSEGDWQHSPIAPPLDIVRDLMALGSWPFPPLVGIIEAPTIRPDGTVLATPGYDAATRLFYIPQRGLTVPTIPNNPTDDDKAQALALLREIICNFPFEDDMTEDGHPGTGASRANAIAAIITPVVRAMIPGCVPMALFDKPQSGTGATLLAELVTRIATGRPAAMYTAPKDDESWKKMITSLLLQGRTVVTVDNLEGKLYSPSLAAAITSTLWADRLLGQNQPLTLPHNACWLGTGNNIRLGGDLPRRCYMVRMDAQQAEPWKRTEFLHPDLLEWVGRERGRILAAILTLARAWKTAGKAGAGGIPTIGGFEGWTRTIGGILVNAGVRGFLANLDTMYAEADDDAPQWAAFLAAWFAIWPTAAVTALTVATAIPDNVALREALPTDLADYDDKGFTKRLGRALARHNGRHFNNGLFIRRANADENRQKWIVKKAVTINP